MSQTQDEIQELEVTIEELKKALARGEALKRLMSNADFKTIIDDDYFVQEASRLTSLLGSPNPSLSDKQEFILHDLHGIAALRRYFDTILSIQGAAQDQIDSHNETLDELRSEYEPAAADMPESD